MDEKQVIKLLRLCIITQLKIRPEQYDSNIFINIIHTNDENDYIIVSFKYIIRILCLSLKKNTCRRLR